MKTKATPSIEDVGKWISNAIGKSGEWRWNAENGFVRPGPDVRIDWPLVMERMLQAGLVRGIAWSQVAAEMRCTVTDPDGKKFTATKPSLARAFSEATINLAAHAMKVGGNG